MNVSSTHSSHYFLRVEGTGSGKAGDEQMIACKILSRSLAMMEIHGDRESHVDKKCSLCKRPSALLSNAAAGGTDRLSVDDQPPCNNDRLFTL